MAARVELYAAPVCPLGNDDVEMTSDAGETVRVKAALW